MKSRLSTIIVGMVLFLFTAGPAAASLGLSSPVEVLPMFGQYMYYLGTVDGDFDDLNDYTGDPGFEGHSTFSFGFTGTDAFSFYYNFLTWDYAGYDEPGFYVNVVDSTGAPINSLFYNAADVDTGSQPLDLTGWTPYMLNGLNPLETYSVEIGAGNTGDGSVQSFAFFDWDDPNDDTFPTSLINPIPYGQAGFTDYFYSENHAVPVPAAVWLLGSGLLGIIGLRRRAAR